MEIVIPEIIIALGVPALRGIAGWLNNALEDKKIEKFEWEKLVETEFRILVGGIVTFYGLSLFGFDINVVAPIVGVTAVDWFYKLFKKE